MGYVGGMTVNIVTVAWLVFAIIFFSFPYYRPVSREFPFLFGHLPVMAIDHGGRIRYSLLMKTL